MSLCIYVLIKKSDHGLGNVDQGVLRAPILEMREDVSDLIITVVTLLPVAGYL